MRARRRVGLAFAFTAVVGAAVACVLADPPAIDQLPPPTRPTILADIVTPQLDQKLTSQPISFDIPIAVDLNQTIEWRVFQDLDLALNPNPRVIVDVVDDGGVTDFADAGNAVRVIDDPFNGLDFSTQCHSFTFVVGFAFDQFAPSTPASVPGCVSCGDSVTWFWEPVPDCNFDDAAPPTQFPEAGDGAPE